MRVFVTGATGFIGSAVVQELLRAGHTVLGLARNDKNANALIAVGAEVHRGDLEDLDSLRDGAAASDAVIHLGFIHDFSRFAEVCAIDKKVIETIGATLEGTNKPFLVTSGTALLQPGKLGTESNKAFPGPNPRIVSEDAVDVIAEKGVRAAVIRLSPSVHGKGDKAFVPMLIDLAHQKGLSAYIGDGQNRWPAVHRLDAATLYRLAVESDFTPGTRFHGAAEEGTPLKEIATLIGKRLNVPVKSLSHEEAGAHFGWFTHFAGVDNPISSKVTQDSLGWKPKEATLLADVDNDYYFSV